MPLILCLLGYQTQLIIRRPPQWCYRQVSTDNASVRALLRILMLLQTHSFIFLGKKIQRRRYKRLFTLWINL